MNQKAVASTEASKARDRVGFGLTHRMVSPPHFLRREQASDMHSTTPKPKLACL